MFRRSVKRKNSDRRVKMETEIVTCNRVPVPVYCWGNVTPSRIIKNLENKPKELILLITGNPGVGKFYFKFAHRIFQNTNLPVWLVGHGGHEKVPVPRLSENPDLYTVEGQAKQKQDLIETYLKGVKVRCVGHSAGCEMIIKLLKSENCGQIIDSSFLLFPTVERLAETPNGIMFKYILKYFYWLLYYGSIMYNALPVFIKWPLSTLVCYFLVMHPSQRDALNSFLNPYSTRQSLYLVEDELKTIQDRDNETLKKFASKIWYYYGTTDKWAPLEYYRSLIKDIPEAKAEICTRGIFHSFVLVSSLVVGDLVSDWVKNN